MTDLMIPGPNALKAQAKRLRATLSENGGTYSHSAALEMIARQYGQRDWNTLRAISERQVTPLKLGDTVSGHYLGHRVSARIKALSQMGPNRHRVTLVFDTPVDVVTSTHFSALRKQVSVTLDASGKTAEKTSDGTPHMIIENWRI